MTTRAFIEKHLAQMRSNRVQVVADLHAVDGAIQLCELMLDEVAQEEQAEAKPEKSSKKGGA